MTTACRCCFGFVNTLPFTPLNRGISTPIRLLSVDADSGHIRWAKALINPAISSAAASDYYPVCVATDHESIYLSLYNSHPQELPNALKVSLDGAVLETYGSQTRTNNPGDHLTAVAPHNTTATPRGTSGLAVASDGAVWLVSTDEPEGGLGSSAVLNRYDNDGTLLGDWSREDVFGSDGGNTFWIAPAVEGRVLWWRGPSQAAALVDPDDSHVVYNATVVSLHRTDAGFFVGGSIPGSSPVARLGFFEYDDPDFVADSAGEITANDGTLIGNLLTSDATGVALLTSSGPVHKFIAWEKTGAGSGGIEKVSETSWTVPASTDVDVRYAVNSDGVIVASFFRSGDPSEYVIGRVSAAGGGYDWEYLTVPAGQATSRAIPIVADGNDFFAIWPESPVTTRNGRILEKFDADGERIWNRMLPMVGRYVDGNFLITGNGLQHAGWFCDNIGGVSGGVLLEGHWHFPYQGAFTKRTNT